MMGDRVHDARAHGRFIVVRPYGPRIRERVFALLAEVGLTPELILQEHLDDREVVAELARRPSLPDLLLVPYHARLDLGKGGLVHGLSALTAIWERLPYWRSVPVLMPVSRLSAGAFRISWHDFALRFEIDDPAAAGVEILHEARLEREPHAELVERLRAFLANTRQRTPKPGRTGVDIDATERIPSGVWSRVAIGVVVGSLCLACGAPGDRRYGGNEGTTVAAESGSSRDERSADGNTSATAPTQEESSMDGLPPMTTFTWIRTELFANGCALAGCHDATRAGDLDLREANAYANLVSVPARHPGAAGMLRVAPGDPDGSFLVVKLEGPGPDQGARMPLGGRAVTATVLAAVRGWIARGAPND